MTHNTTTASGDCFALYRPTRFAFVNLSACASMSSCDCPRKLSMFQTPVSTPDLGHCANSLDATPVIFETMSLELECYSDLGKLLFIEST